MANVVFNRFKREVMGNGFSLSGGDVTLALMTSAYTPDQDADGTWADISANEASGTGYTAGGKAIESPVLSQDNTDNEGVFDGSDVTWASSTISARWGVLYVSAANPAASVLIGALDFTETKSSSNGNFTVQFDAEGILNLT